MWTQQQQQQLQQQQRPTEQQKKDEAARTLGMTSAISSALPKPIDIQRTQELMEALKPFNVTESDAELSHR